MSKSNIYIPDKDKDKLELLTLVCKKCNKTFQMVMPLDDTIQISDSIRKQHDLCLCDECFVEHLNEEV